jgi:thiol-disulfide isomerase/thioredoxin
LATILVCCLCAEWCSSCREYRRTFLEVEQEFPDVRFLWIDVEDQSELMGEIDIENFPTLLIVAGERPCFFGPLTPQRDVLARLVDAHRVNRDDVVNHDPTALAWVARLRAIAG